MKIHFMKDDALAYFKGNISYFNQYYHQKNNKWIFKLFQEYKKTDESPFEMFKLEVPSFKLNMSSLKPENTDYQNIKILYTSLKDISDSQATDERFWVGLAHYELWDYMQYRCKLNDKVNIEDKIINNYFFLKNNRKALNTNYLSRLWWTGRLTYDENEEDKFKALAYFKKDFSTKSLYLFSYSYSNNPKIVQAILLAINYIENKGHKVTRRHYVDILRYVNQLGGILILDYLDKKELMIKVVEHFFLINENVYLENKTDFNKHQELNRIIKMNND